MIKSQIIKNETVQPNTRELEKLKEILPQYFDKEGNFKLDSFKEMLKLNEINVEKEGYELKFLGKNYSKFQSGLETETVIVPDIEHNSKEENINSENMYIVGDNLDALKHLLKSYSNKIKCIYIDPPYNTGKDGFVYNDNFSFTPEVLSEKMGIDEEEAKRIIELRGKSNHSAWLTFMYPRLELARDLLTDDGVIFISIDDNEQANLKLMCDEIFGEENFIKDLIVNTSEGGGNAKYVVNGHEVVFVYVKNVMKFDNLKRPKDIRGKKVYINGELYWIQEDAIREQFGKYGNLHYEDLTDIKGENFKKKIDLGIKNNEYILVPKAYGKTIIGKLRKVSEDFSKFHSILNVGRINKHLTADGIRELEELFEVSKGNSPFENPKPLELIKRLILATTFKGNNNDIILDFFSGSATTAHTVMELNKGDNGNRKYIMVQLPEEIKEDKVAYKEGYRTIDEIGRERIRKAGEKIKGESPNVDCGFKLFRLKEVEKNMIDKIIEFDPNIPSPLFMDDYVEAFKYENTSGKDTILTTWLNQDGYGLIAKYEKIKLINYEIDVCNNSAYIIEHGITSEDIIKLIEMIEENILQINRIVVYPYSLRHNTLLELRNNLKQIELIERY